MKYFKLLGLLVGMIAFIAIAYFEYMRKTYVVSFNNRDDVVGLYYSCSDTNLASSDLLDKILQAPRKRVDDVKGVAKITMGIWITIQKNDGREYKIQFVVSSTESTRYDAIVSFSGQRFKTFDGTSLINNVGLYCQSRG